MDTNTASFTSSVTSDSPGWARLTAMVTAVRGWRRERRAYLDTGVMARELFRL
jgi:hypothetical protein